MLNVSVLYTLSLLKKFTLIIQKLNARADYLSYIIFIFCHSMNSQPLNCCVCIDITAYAQKYWDIWLCFPVLALMKKAWVEVLWYWLKIKWHLTENPEAKTSHWLCLLRQLDDSRMTWTHRGRSWTSACRTWGRTTTTTCVCAIKTLSAPAQEPEHWLVQTQKSYSLDRQGTKRTYSFLCFRDAASNETTLPLL